MKMKTWYDRRSRQRSLQAGQKVLMLLPTSNNKLLATWQGPFTVLRQVNETNYEVDLGHRFTTLHINLLKEWYERDTELEQEVNMILVAEESEDEIESILSPIDTTNNDGWQIGSQLNEQQRAELLLLLDEFQDVFGKKPGRTHLIEHRLQLTDDRPCAQKMYKIPEKLKEQVEEQIKQMLTDGLISESDSNYAAPIIFVKKREDPAIRIVCDFRKLNE
jgi:hypothetical protein